MAKATIIIEDNEDQPGEFNVSFEFDPPPELAPLLLDDEDHDDVDDEDYDDELPDLTPAQTKAFEIINDHFMSDQLRAQLGCIPEEEESQIIVASQKIITPH